MAKLWPSRSSTVVRARRVVRDGITVPDNLTAFAKSSSLTSGMSFKLMTPRQNGRRETELHAEFLVDNGDRRESAVLRRNDRHWVFAAPAKKSAVSPDMYGRSPFGKDFLAASALSLERSCIRPVGAAR